MKVEAVSGPVRSDFIFVMYASVKPFFDVSKAPGVMGKSAERVSP